MRRFLRPVSGILLLMLVLVVCSCTVSQTLVINREGSGTALVSVTLSPMLLSYYNDLMTAISGVPGEYPVFDLEQLSAEFARRPSVELVNAQRPARGRLQLEVAFDDLNEVMADAAAGGPAGATGAPGAADVFSFAARGSSRVLIVRLDREAVRRFVSFAPAESASMMQFLLPPEGDSMSMEEYRDELAWAFEEYGSADEVLRALNNSVIEVTVRPAGRIQSQQGGVVRGDAVVFRVPVLEMLTLSESRVYEVVFAP